MLLKKNETAIQTIVCVLQINGAGTLKEEAVKYSSYVLLVYGTELVCSVLR